MRSNSFRMIWREVLWSPLTEAGRERGYYRSAERSTRDFPRQRLPHSLGHEAKAHRRFLERDEIRILHPPLEFQGVGSPTDDTLWTAFTRGVILVE